MDMRKRYIVEKWEQKPLYNIDKYAHHYFYKDFDKIKDRCIESHEVSERKRKDAYNAGNSEVESENQHQK